MIRRRAVLALFLGAAGISVPHAAGADASLDPKIIARAQAAMVVVECPTGSVLNPKRASGVIVASNDKRSYIVTPSNPTCQRTVFVHGDTLSAFAAHPVPISGQGLYGLEIVSIERGNLPVAQFGTSALSAGNPFILSFTEDATPSPSTHVIEPRLDELSGSTAANGITSGAGVFDRSTGGFIGVVSGNSSFPSLEPNVRPAARVSYSVGSQGALCVMIKNAADDIWIGKPCGQVVPEGEVAAGLRAIEDVAVPVMMRGGLIDSPNSYWNVAAAFPIGADRRGTLLISSLPGHDFSDVAVVLRDANGVWTKVAATVIYHDPYFPFSVLLIPAARKVPGHFASAVANEALIVPYYEPCMLAPASAVAACRLRGWARTVEVLPPIPLKPGVNIGDPNIARISGSASLGTAAQGAPVLDAKTHAVVGLALGGIFQPLFLTVNQINEILAKNDIGITLHVGE
jgi:hypothetical protein